jgi:hypothetical protein
MTKTKRMTMTPTQTLASGQTPTSKYGAFGLREFDEVAGPAYMFAMIVSEPGQGKTSLYRDHPGSLILNFDRHSLPKPSPSASPPKCAVYPAVDREGRWIDENRKVINLQWKHVVALKDKLLEAARRNQPRPQTIVLDTLAPTIPLMKEWWATTNGYQGGWDAIPGGKPSQSAYGKVYDAYIPFITDLLHVGYGVHILAHIMTVMVRVSKDEDIRIPTTQHNVPDKLYERFFPLLEFLGAIERKSVATGEKDKDGKVRYEKKIIKRYLVNLSDKLSEMHRARVALPERIELPATDAWHVFESEYLKAAGQTPKETP